MRRFSKITTTQLARICGVSQGTVDRALHNRDGINPETKERILTVAREYDYLPSVQGGAPTNSMLIGVVLYDLYNEFFSKLAMSIVNTARLAGYSIIFQFSGKDERREKAALEYFDYIGVDGIILFSTGSDSEEYKTYLQLLKRPMVLIGNRMFDLPYVGIDDTAAMRSVTERLIKQIPLGDILYYAPVLKEHLHKDNAQRLRLDGFLKAVTVLGRNYRIVTTTEELTNFGGIVCSTDYYALKAWKYLGYSQDVKLAGFDNISLLKKLPLKMWTVEYSTDQIAQECLNYILGRRFNGQIQHRVTYHTD
ncbi:MAG: LacI family DNA-binding transcriptional regulator [Clostridia bacterium]|nr:LacI family DNA-binding transcriptional regulator [Clostridia bacterium]